MYEKKKESSLLKQDGLVTQLDKMPNANNRARQTLDWTAYLKWRRSVEDKAERTGKRSGAMKRLVRECVTEAVRSIIAKRRMMIMIIELARDLIISRYDTQLQNCPLFSVLSFRLGLGFA